MAQHISVKDRLLKRLRDARPDWSIYDDLLRFVESLRIEAVNSEYLGNFVISGSRLAFSEPEPAVFQKWLPVYVPALHGMKAAHWEDSGGYAAYFNNALAEQGGVFMYGSRNDEECGFPLIDIPANVYPFQSNQSGACFFINTDLEILYPNAQSRSFNVLDSLAKFTQVSIKQVLLGKPWFEAYSDQVNTRLLD